MIWRILTQSFFLQPDIENVSKIETLQQNITKSGKCGKCTIVQAASV